VKEDAAAAGIICPIVGHVGDGNFHAALIYRNQKEFKKVEDLSKKVVERALELDGTCEFLFSSSSPFFIACIG
jgi:D-lactate dehydrogenase (cytochrome)